MLVETSIYDMVAPPTGVSNIPRLGIHNMKDWRAGLWDSHCVKGIAIVEIGYWCRSTNCVSVGLHVLSRKLVSRVSHHVELN